MMFRNQAFFTVLAAGGKVRKPEELWTVFLDGIQEPDKILPLTEEEFAALVKDKYEGIKKKHGIN